jgi:DNA-binding protein Rv2175c, wHTH domain
MAGRASTLSPESLDYLPGSTAAEKRSLAKWYAAARAALARNRPLTTAATSTSDRRRASDFTAAEAAALRSVGAFKDETPIQASNDPLIRSQAQYMALLEESLSAAEAAKLLHVDVSRVRQRLRERSLFGIEHEGSWRLPRFQFERRLVIPGLAQILKALPPDLFPLDVVDWFLLPDADLQLDSDTAPASPREWLLSGRPVETVVTLARDLTRA